MPKISRNFTAGKMNKSIDERLLPEGEYIDAMNIRMGSTEKAEVGVIENTMGNVPLTTLYGPGGIQLSVNAMCIGALEDSAFDTIYWLVHDKTFPAGATGKCDMIVSFNILTNVLTYHVVSTDDGSGTQTTLNFNSQYVITGINKINDLFFFTDDYNDPRCINVTKKYGQPVGYIDTITKEELLVIKKPPTQSPSVQPVTTSGQETYMEDRFLSFAYRYQYADGEYSATSQWSQIAFISKPFEFSRDSMLNEGMTNLCNGAIITYNSGGPLVVGIDLLFKQSANNIIKVIEKLDKANLGLADSTDYTYSFNNSKIFTVLPESELLRLYDNVPLKAKAQTIMGNRLMYGNYVEGYDLVDKFGFGLKLEYTANLITEPIGTSSLPDNQQSGSFSINGAQTIPNASTFIDLDGFDLKAGSALSIIMTFAHSSYSGNLPFPVQTTGNIEIQFDYFLVNDYTSVYQMATSPEFVAAVGSALPLGNIKPVYSATPGVDTSCDGSTFTDAFNCALPNSLGGLTKVASGISADGQGIQIISLPGSTQIGFQLLAMKYVNNPAAPSQTVYEYYSISFTSATFQEVANTQSLHSNRGYEIGIVYMDEFNRSSTALVSPNNTVHIPCGYSANKNGIQVIIPPEQRAPYWAKRYKFVIKPDSDNYEVIYSTLFYEDPSTNEVWFLLEGENSRKVEVGDRLIVKSDANGPTANCVYATVLEKAAKEANFITPTSGVSVLGGVYMKINPNNFDITTDPNATIAPGELSVYAPPGGTYNKLNYPMNIVDPNTPGSFIDYSVPAGSRISIKWDWDREGTNAICEHRGYTYEKTFIASTDYDNMEDWFIGDNVATTFASGFSKDGTTAINFISTNGILSTFNFDVCYVQFYRNPTTNELILQLGTGESCTGGSKKEKRYYVKSTITVYRALNTIVFETEPTDALPDVFFENNLSFAIDDDGNHMGNLFNQDIALGVAGVVNTQFFNCFAFGNGAESYKVRDSIGGRYFTLGERVTSVSEQDYMAADRFADITYSGVYNAETNLNKLNEFNSGLLNFKNLEQSFGSIYIMDGRETDVLVLQEDKISYVLAGKNLLSDSAAGGAITSVPEVLGTQMARTEKYGISFNPESYVQWGYDRYFTDVKRGVVINLKGDSSSQDQLTVVSEFSMRTWFRDEFNSKFNTQKLGAYDPYMNEYVLVSNDVPTPKAGGCISCGVSQTLTLTNNNDEGYATFEFCVNLGTFVGDTDIDWSVISSGEGDFKIDVIYGTNTFSSGWTNVLTGTVTYDKNEMNDQVATVIISYYPSTLSIELLPKCPPAEQITIVEVVLANNSDAGDTTHIEYRYTMGAFVGALQSIPVTFGSSVIYPVVTRYNPITGNAGTAGFPTPGSTMRIQSNQIVPDNFVFNPINDKFRWLRSSVLYPNDQDGINDLIAASSLATPITGSGTTYFSTFNVPAGGQYLYLIWDYRDALPVKLCYTNDTEEVPVAEICCDCLDCTGPCITVQLTNLGGGIAEVYFPFGNEGCGGESGSFSVELEPEEVYNACITQVGAYNLWEVMSGTVKVEILACECGDFPQNIVPPVLSYTGLYPGDTITSSDGTWINV